MLNINLKEVFSSPGEREAMARQKEQEEIAHSDYGDPARELKEMFEVSQKAKLAFQAITLVSTAALLYRVLISHSVDILGETVGSVVCGFIVILAAYFIEKMIEYSHKPFWKKIFTQGQFSVIMFFIAAVFTSTVIFFAYKGTQVMAEDSFVEAQTESVVSMQLSTNERLAEINKEVAKIQNCEIKGYCWRTNLTKEGRARLSELSAEKRDLSASLLAATNATTASNMEKVENSKNKLSKYQKYLSIVAMGAEVLKICIFIFWGHRDGEITEWRRTKGLIGGSPVYEIEDFEDEDEYEAEPTQPHPSPIRNRDVGYKTDAKVQDYQKLYDNAIQYRDVFTTRTRNNHNFQNPRRSWEENEKKLKLACIELGLNYSYQTMPVSSNG